MRVCLIADRPSLAQSLMPHIRDLHPDRAGDGFVCARVNAFYHLNPMFDLPRGMRWRDYPFSGEPRYHPFRFGRMGRAGRWDNGLQFGSDERVVVREDGEVVRDEDGNTWKQWGLEAVPGDPCAEALARFRSADVVNAVVDPGPAAWLALSRCLEYLDLPARCEVRVPWFTSLHAEPLRSALAAPLSPRDARYAEILAMGRIRTRFDYGYIANALAVRLSGLGRRFLDLLHPDSEDRDLPSRLRSWTVMPEEEANARVDRYLRIFFGKQVRFLSRRHEPTVNEALRRRFLPGPAAATRAA